MPHPPATPARVVSLLPSATEILALLDAHSRLVGRSHECDFPASITAIPALTTSAATPEHGSQADIDRAVRQALANHQALYHLNSSLLSSLKPDLIITQDLCDVCSISLDSVRTAAARITPPPSILSLNPTTLEGVLDDVLRIGDALNLSDRAAAEVVRLRERLFTAEEHVNPFVHGHSVVFLEWTDPFFVGGHWIPQMIERAGGRHPLNPTVPKDTAGAAIGPQMAERIAGKSIVVTQQQIAEAEPQVVIVSPCGIPLEHSIALAQHVKRQPWAQNAAVYAVDGNHMFSRPGPRLIDAFEFLVGILNDLPELIPSDFPFARI